MRFPGEQRGLTLNCQWLVCSWRLIWCAQRWTYLNLLNKLVLCATHILLVYYSCMHNCAIIENNTRARCMWSCQSILKIESSKFEPVWQRIRIRVRLVWTLHCTHKNFFLVGDSELQYVVRRGPARRTTWQLLGIDQSTVKPESNPSVRSYIRHQDSRTFWVTVFRCILSFAAVLGVGE